ncbi:general stress protein [Rufibacter sp. DG15C]|uniref:pyridoxamine 5'-phosphate oxidase family protein n=1 Tax=Rufibacter sp. DG15C TaxID=1379909 RepID=UPI00078E26BE|nr:pyridoxamine 5'-phosphate oxidase family protein [Rufibacter sp. DG15C]AMM52273.1 general stress protein [Rufibacter sp. DG15C]
MENQSNNQQKDIKTLLDKIKAIDVAMLSTVEPDGTIRSRPMRHMKADENATIWFLTGYASGKTHEIKNESHVNLSYADPSNNLYVSISGHATVNRDQQKIDELWNPAMKAWFPEGKEDPNIGVLKITIDQAEYWDSPNSAVVHLYGMAKAIITGEPAHPGENKKINL